MDLHKNLAISSVLTAPSPATSGTSLVVASGEGARFPAVPFNATVWPATGQQTPANAEIVRVTAISTDTLTIARAQESTTARSIVVGDRIMAGPTAKTFTDIELGIDRPVVNPLAATLPTLPGMSFANTPAPFAMNANIDHLLPFHCEDAVTFDQVLIEVTTATAAGNTGRVAMYTADASYQPVALVEDFGSFLTDSAAVKTLLVAGGAAGPQGFSDNFNRADGALGANWIAVAQHQIVSNVVSATDSPDRVSHWATQCDTVDQFAQITTGSTLTSTGVTLRGDGDPAATFYGYWVYYSSATTLQVRRIVAGTGSSLGTINIATLVANDVLRAEISGNTINVYVNGVFVGSVTDNGTALTGKYVGFVTSNTTNIIDDWSGGDWVSGKRTIQPGHYLMVFNGSANTTCRQYKASLDSAVFKSTLGASAAIAWFTVSRTHGAFGSATPWTAAVNDHSWFCPMMLRVIAVGGMAAHKNFAISSVATAPSPASSGTSIIVASGEGARFPAVPFNATIWPANSQPTPANAEIVRVTAISTDTLTITRAQESTSARTVVVGDQIAAGITAKSITDIKAGHRHPIVNPAAVSLITTPGVRSSTNVSNTTMVANTDYIQPIWIRDYTTFDQLVLEVVTGSSTSTTRIALYTADASWQPVTLIEDFGSINSGTGQAGVKTIAPSAGSRTLPPGRYVIVHNSSVTPAFRELRGTLATSILRAALTSTMYVGAFTASRTYGAFGAATPWTTVLNDNAQRSYVAMRVTAVGGDAYKNFGVSSVLTAPSPASSGTSLVVASGEGTRFPAVPFNASIWPVNTQPTPVNTEIVRVTAISTDTLTIIRMQESTSARTVVVGDQIAASITAKSLTDIEQGIPRAPVDSAVVSLLCVPGVGGAGNSGQGTGQIGTSGFDQLMPFECRDYTTFDRLYCEITTGGTAGSFARWAIYTADSSWQPVDLVEDFGTVTADSAAIKTLTPAAGSRTLPPGRYLMVMTTNAVTVPIFRFAYGSIDHMLCLPAMGSNVVARFRSTRTYGAFGAAVPWSSLQTANGGQFMGFLRVTGVGG